MSHHDPVEIREAFKFAPYEVQVWTAQDQTIVDYFDEELMHVGRFGVRLMDDGGVGWTSAWGARVGQGFYTHLMRWAAAQPSAYQWPPTEADRRFYLSTGWVETDDPTMIRLDRKAAKKWLEGR